MDKFTFKTADGIDVNLEKLSRAFPEVITETMGEDGKIRRVADFEKLKMLLGDSAAERPQEFYEFTWPGKNEAIFEVAHYDEKLAEKIWEEGSDEVLIKAFEKTDKDSLFWGEQTIERKNV